MLITIYDCLILGLAIALLSARLDGRSRAADFFAMWGLAFVTDLVLFGAMEQYSMPGIAAVLTIYKKVIQKESLPVSLFLSTTAVICALACVLSCTSVFILFFPEVTGQAWYEILIGLLQFCAAAGLSFLLRGLRALTFQSAKTIRKVTAAQTAFLILYTAVLPCLAFLPNMEPHSFLVVYSVFSLFIMAMAVFYICFIHSAFQTERHYVRAENEIQIQKAELERMRQFWDKAVVNDHTLLGMYQSMGRYIYQNDLPGLRAYFTEYILPAVRGAAVDEIQNLEHIKSPLLRNIVDAKFRLARSLGIPILVEIIGEIAPDMREYDLFQVLNIYLDNAINACAGHKGRIAVIFSIRQAAVQILIKNTVASDADSLAAILPQTGNETLSQHGNGLEIADKILGQYGNVFKNLYLENGEFTVKLIIGEKEC